jgi:hypothetical protein
MWRSLVTKASLGELVLFKIDSGDFGVWRPLLVTFVHDNGSVDGELFLSWERDKRAEWPAKYLFWGLDAAHRTVEVRNVSQGEELGKYQFATPGGMLRNVDASLTALEARIASLEKANENRGKLVQQPPKPLIPEKRTK